MTTAALQLSWLVRDYVRARLPDLSCVIAFEVGFCLTMLAAVMA